MIIRIALLITLILSGQAWAFDTCRHSRIDTLCAALADDLVSSIQIRVNRSESIMGVSFVDLHAMDQTSDLGRILSEQIANNFFQYGYQIVEPRLRSESVTTHDENGEFALTRKLQNLDPSVEVYAFLTGTYAVADNSIAVSARIIHAQSKAILAAAHCNLRISPEVRHLLIPTSPTTRRHYAPILQIKNKNDAMQIQVKLRVLGFYSGRIDGIWGRRSKKALRDFRASQGLTATSDWDMETQNLLMPQS